MQHDEDDDWFIDEDNDIDLDKLAKEKYGF